MIELSNKLVIIPYLAYCRGVPSGPWEGLLWGVVIDSRIVSL